MHIYDLVVSRCDAARAGAFEEEGPCQRLRGREGMPVNILPSNIDHYYLISKRLCDRNRDLSRTTPPAGPPQRVFVGDHAGLVINKFSLIDHEDLTIGPSRFEYTGLTISH